MSLTKITSNILADGAAQTNLNQGSSVTLTVPLSVSSTLTVGGSAYVSSVFETNKTLEQLSNKNFGFIPISSVNHTLYPTTSAVYDFVNDAMLYAGAFDLPTIVDNGNGTVNISAGVFCFAKDEFGAEPHRTYPIAGGTYSLTDNAINFVLANLNDGSPILQVSTSNSTVNAQTIYPVFVITRAGNNLDIVDLDHESKGLPNKITLRLARTRRIEPETGGLIIGTGVNQKVTITSGRAWFSATSTTLPAFDSSLSAMRMFYHSAGNWISTPLLSSRYENSRYDDGTNLQTLTNNRYAVSFIYRNVANNSNKAYMVLGQGDYTLGQAQQAIPPAPLPAEVANTLFVGRVITQKGALSATQVDSAFTSQFSLAGVTDHESLANLQGGAVNDHSHVTAVERSYLQSLQPVLSAIGTTGIAISGTSFIRPGGSFGIGTTTPFAPLHVTSAGTTSLRIDCGVGQSSQFQILAGGAFKNLFGYSATFDGFQIYNYGTALPELFIPFSTGKVGIGTTNPNEKLTVVGNLSTTGSGNISGALLVGSGATTAKLTVKSPNANNSVFDVLHSTSANPLFRVAETSGSVGTVTQYSAGGGVINRLDSGGSSFITGGNFGVGTSAPSARLHSISTTEQQRLGYDGANYVSTTVGSTGGATFSNGGTATDVWTYNGNMVLNGTTNRAPNQVPSTSDSILIKSYIDVRDNYTSYYRLTADNSYTSGVIEHFNDFLEPLGTSTGVTSQTTGFAVISAGGGTISQGFNDGASADIMINAPSGTDVYSYYGAAQFSVNSTNGSAAVIYPVLSIAQNRGRYYTKNAAWRYMLAQNDPTQYLRFGIQPPLGGSGSPPVLLSNRVLCVDTSISPNFFFANTLGRVYSLSADTGIPALTGVWTNLYLDHTINTATEQISCIDLTVYYTRDNQRYTYRFTPTGADLSYGSVFTYTKQQGLGILLGQQDPAGGNPARKAILLDWWYLKTASRPIDSIAPSNWNSTRFLK